MNYNIKQGNTSPLIEAGPPEMVASAGWTCQMRLLNPDGTVAVDRSITETNDADNKFLVYLTPAETAALVVETYRWIVEIDNSSLVPPFHVEEHHMLNVDPQIEVGNATGIVQLVVGSNSFGTYETLLRKLSEYPMLDQASTAARGQLKSALTGAYQNIGDLTVKFEDANGDVVQGADGTRLTSTRDLTSALIAALEVKTQDALLRAQLIEANGLLGGNPIEDRRRMGLLSDSSGESAHFFRVTKPLELPVYKATAWALKGYLTWSKRIGK